MIRILRLKHFKCFQDQAFELKPLTLLTGLNGMGKSSVLQSFLLLRQSYERGLLQGNGLALNDYLVRLGTGKDVYYEGAQEEEEIGFYLELDEETCASWTFVYKPDADVLEPQECNVPAEIFTCSLFSQDFQYLQAERMGPRATFDISDFLVRGKRQLGPSGEFTTHFLAEHGNEKIPNLPLMHENAVSESLLNQVEAWMGEVSPGTRIHARTFADLDVASLQYSFARGGVVGERFRATNVGFGLTYTLPILVAVLSAQPGALIIIENPEAHLHPKGQSRFGELMALAAACGVQVLVETHSDHLVNGVRIAVHEGKISPDLVKILFFQRSEQPGESFTSLLDLKISREGRIDQWPENFFDEWDKALERLLAPGKE